MYMNQYAEMRKKAEDMAEKVKGLHASHAEKVIEEAGLHSRWVRFNGHACVVTRDVRLDRIGLIVENGIVVDTEIG